MKRKIYETLLKWKATGGESALLLNGARRVGKSYIAEKFAQNEYRSYILIDFNKVEANVRDWFSLFVHDLDTLFSYLSNYFGVKLYERESLIIFDEVQECPRARAAIKYLVEDGRYDYLETGSLVSIMNNVTDIVIPSEEEHVKMFPMDFEEFLWATGNDTMMDLIRSQFEAKRPMGEAMHRKIMSYFRLYMIIGGMPQVVAKWIETQSFEDTDKVKERILALYRADIAKHAGGHTQKVKSVFDAIPSQLSKHEKKFTMASINKAARLREYEDSFFWLEDAMIVNLCFNSTEPNIGLRLNAERTTMKCYMADTGFLLHAAFSNNGKTEQTIYQKLLTDKLEVNKGMLVENIVAQMLRTAGHDLFFFSNPSPGDVEKRMEVDFLIQKRNLTSRHNITPIEVKSSTRYTHTSLDRLRKIYAPMISTPYVLHTKDMEEKGGVIYLPLYMASLL